MEQLQQYLEKSNKGLFHYLVELTKLLATGNLARDGLIKVVSVYCGICTLYYRYRSDTTGIGIDPPLLLMVSNI